MKCLNYVGEYRRKQNWLPLVVFNVYKPYNFVHEGPIMLLRSLSLHERTRDVSLNDIRVRRLRPEDVEGVRREADAIVNSLGWGG